MRERPDVSAANEVRGEGVAGGDDGAAGDERDRGTVGRDPGRIAPEVDVGEASQRAGVAGPDRDRDGDGRGGERQFAGPPGARQGVDEGGDRDGREDGAVVEGRRPVAGAGRGEAPARVGAMRRATGERTASSSAGPRTDARSTSFCSLTTSPRSVADHTIGVPAY